MTNPAPHSAASPPLLDDRSAAQSVIEAFWASQSRRAPRSRVSRLLGLSPLGSESRSWFVGALGEIEVAERLRALSTSRESWRVLHSVPVGRGAADIDHVVLGPPGVFTLNTKNLPDRKVWVGERTVLVDGQRTPYLRNARFEAERSAKLLGAALGRAIEAAPLIVVVGAESVTVKQQPDGVTVLPQSRLIRYLRRQPAKLSVDEVRELTRVALRPRTWQPRPSGTEPTAEPIGDSTGESSGAASASSAGSAGHPPAPVPSAAELQTWFARVRQEVRRARRVRVLWAVGILVALVAALVLPGIVLPGLVLPLLAD